VSVTLYIPGPGKKCVGFAKADVLIIPEAGSPKFQSKKTLQTGVADVKFTVLLLLHVQVKSEDGVVASPIHISSTANPS
jgi:hypothetical protein